MDTHTASIKDLIMLETQYKYINTIRHFLIYNTQIMVPAAKIQYSFTILVYMRMFLVYLSTKRCIKHLISKSNSFSCNSIHKILKQFFKCAHLLSISSQHMCQNP